jgi:transcriptional regulator with XRE-family HTH domain
MHIGKQIRQARRAAGYTQEELAGLINKTRPLISHIETSGKINSHTLSAIAKVLDLSPYETGENLLDYQKDNSAKKEKALQEKFISSLLEEIKTLKELVTTQREMISMLKLKK